MFGSIIRHQLPVVPVASLLDNQPRSCMRVKDPACLSSDASPTKERAKDEERREEETSRRRKRKRKRSKRHESSEENEPKPLDRNHRGHHHHRRGQGERVVRIPGGPELVVPHGVTNYRVVHEDCRYKLLLNPETGKLRNFSMKKIQDYS